MNQHRSKERPWLCSLKVAIFFALLQTAIALTPFEDYEKCVKSENFGKSGLICDPEHTLKNSTIEKLDALLKNLQENAKRPSRCSNTNETQKYIGLLQVSESNQIADSGSSLKDIAKRIYDSIGLGNTDCDNGVLIFYLRDKQQLATYNGNGHFVQLSNADIDKLHKLSGRDDEGGALALQFLRDNQANSDNGDLQRAESWAPVVGLTAAVVLVFLILALCLAIFLARFCCCASRSKKNKYYVTPIPSYKTVDPIYIVTPPVSERHGPHSDIIYSTPYSGTPLPHSAPIYGPSPYYSSSHAQTPRSNYGRSITPTSTTNRISMTPHVHVKSAEQTPRSNKKDKIDRSGTAASKHSNATYHTVNNSSATTLPAVESSPERGDLPFLDPKRKQEVQTREDFIA